ncbi:hypothetical protein LV35_04255 [Acinetobacter baumannii]|uniref:Uncharacterized protein n=2 Tax=Acinetobacter baumannii TaxID=470 RepID=A0AAJ0QTG6_ACIBA|nr:hypothetical protein LV35_04255 [Acinetobacter baumannii]
MISPESFQALVPTLISRPNPLIWFTGSAVDQRIHIGCEQFAGLRYRALNSEPGKRICYLEWSAPEDLEDFSDKEAWWMANPGGGIRITEEDIQAEYDSFMAAGGERAFGVQRLGVGDWPLLGASRSEIPLEHWRRLANPEPELTGARALVLYRAPEGGPWAIVGSQRCTDGRIHLEVGYTGEDSVDRVVGMFVQAVTAWGPAEVRWAAAAPQRSSRSLKPWASRFTARTRPKRPRLAAVSSTTPWLIPKILCFPTAIRPF